jgi:hypothetical protein
MGIIRSACVFGAIVFVLPLPPAGQSNSTGQDTSWHVVSAARETFSDMKTFCERQPDVCVTADYVAGQLEAKTKYSLQLLYEWANEATGARQSAVLADQAAIDALSTGTLSVAPNETADITNDLRGSIYPDQG